MTELPPDHISISMVNTESDRFRHDVNLLIEQYSGLPVASAITILDIIRDELKEQIR
jgi:hypothetical protein